MDLLHKEQEKPEQKRATRVIDFPDIQTKDIFACKWHNYAYLLGLRFLPREVMYGENNLPKVRYEFSVEGDKEKVMELLKFVNQSLELPSDIDEWPDT